MKTVAILYCSKYGQTEKIVHYMMNQLLLKGVPVQVYSLDNDPQHVLDSSVDAVILGGPIYAKQFPKPLVNWASRNKGLLHKLSTAFFSVSLNAADRRPESRLADDDLLMKFISQSGWSPQYITSLAGALKYTEYSWLIKRIMRWISLRAGGPVDLNLDHEYTNWSTVDRFLEHFVSEKSPSEFRVESRLLGETVANDIKWLPAR